MFFEMKMGALVDLVNNPEWPLQEFLVSLKNTAARPVGVNTQSLSRSAPSTNLRCGILRINAEGCAGRPGGLHGVFAMWENCVVGRITIQLRRGWWG